MNEGDSDGHSTGNGKACTRTHSIIKARTAPPRESEGHAHSHRSGPYLNEAKKWFTVGQNPHRHNTVLQPFWHPQHGSTGDNTGTTTFPLSAPPTTPQHEGNTSTTQSTYTPPPAWPPPEPPPPAPTTTPKKPPRKTPNNAQRFRAATLDHPQDTADSRAPPTGPGKALQLGWWNIRGILEPAKLKEVILHMETHRLWLLLLTETHTKESDTFCFEGYTVFHSADETKGQDGEWQQNFTGVAAVVHPRLRRAITAITAINGRMLRLDISTHRQPTTVFAVYAPHNEREEATKDTFWDKLDEECAKVQLHRQLLVAGDLNTETGHRGQGETAILGAHTTNKMTTERRASQRAPQRGRGWRGRLR